LNLGSVFLLAIVAILFLLGPWLGGLAVDWLWFSELGRRAVLVKLLGTRVGLGLGFGLALAGFAYANTAAARRFGRSPLTRRNNSPLQETVSRLARGGLTVILVVGSAVLGWLGGYVASTRWDTWLRFANAQSFGSVDPVFHRDLGFYLFKYPLLQFVSGWLFTTLLLVFAATAVVYYLEGAMAFNEPRARVSNPARVHLSLLLGLAFLAKAWDYSLDRFSLLFQPSGLLFGAGYTDIHARLPALNILIVIALIAAAGFFVNAYIRALVLPVVAVGVMVVASVTLGGLYPGLVQRFSVLPDEQAKESPYIERYLEATRQAYGLDTIDPVEYNPRQPLVAADLRRERNTLDNARLWDYRVLSDTYHGLQRLRDYYDVRDVDIDRYTLNGQYRQVMLAPRELVPEQLEPRQRSWINERLQYTHGYGMVMSSVSETDASGRPSWLIHDLPLSTAAGLEITRPQLYYGMKDQPPVIAPSRTKEFDYPIEGGSENSSYSGPGGIPLRSSLARWLFSAQLADWNISISDTIQPQSRLLIRRNIRERVAALAPFLRLDSDPYLVIEGGRMVWMQDAYTVASTYPYSDPATFAENDPTGPADALETGQERFNYVRNSVKATVDAYTGEVHFYVMDATDPVIRCYQRAFPGLFEDRAKLPADLVAHLRYPEDLFNAQAQKWTRFHVTNPDVFYARSDVWAIPEERLKSGQQNHAQMEPYYVVMRLPGEKREEFVLILPFKTRNGTTMSGWLTARCDGKDYGRLRLYRFPTNSQIDAPEQVDSTIQSDPEVSREVTLLGQHDSSVRYGNMLVLPVANSLLYVKPLYLEAQQSSNGQSGIPVLKHVILAEKRGAAMKVVMRPTFREALAELVGAPVSGATVEPSALRDGPAPVKTPAGGSDLARLADEAGQAFEAAEKAQRSGNWAEYGRQLQRTREAIRRLRAGVR
jgi:uncharacterized membrane protein (UPF0182 family)